MKRNAIAFSAALSLTVAGCAQESGSSASPANPIQLLQDLPGNPKSTTIQDLFNALLDTTASVDGYGIQLLGDVHQDQFSSDGTLVATEEQMIQTLLLDKDNATLYSILRDGPVNGETPVATLISSTATQTISIGASYQDGESLSTQDPQLRIDTIQPAAVTGVDASDEEAVQAALYSALLRNLTILAGSFLPVPIYQCPQAYTIEAKAISDGWQLSAVLKDADTWNEQAMESNLAQSLQLDHIDSISVSSCTLTICISAAGAITSTDAEYAASIDYNGMQAAISASGLWQTSAAMSAQDCGFLKDLFSKIGSGALKTGDTFVLDITASDTTF